jgi:hypothetical protein
MGMLGKIFGSKKVIEESMTLIDNAFYTGEEKASDRIVMTNQKIAILKAYEAFKVAQRLIALSVTIPYMLAWLTTFVVSFFVDDISAQEALLSGDVGGIVKQITGFYFLGALADVIGRKTISALAVRNRPVG